MVHQKQGADTLVVVPDLDICGADEANPWFMDVDAPARKVQIGLSRTRITTHVLYHREPGMVLGPGKVELGFFIAAYKDENEPRDPWSRVTRFLWRRWGHRDDLGQFARQPNRPCR